MKPLWLPLAALLASGAGCASHRPTPAPVPRAAQAAAPELTTPDFLFAVLRYLYRWHLDAAMSARLTDAGSVEVWVRTLDVETDEGDRSRFAELWLPDAGLLVDLKQADHEVPERRLVLKDDGFKIRAVGQPVSGPTATGDWTIVRLPSPEVRAHLFQTRAERQFPDAALEARLRDALVDHLRTHHEREGVEGAQTFHAAPLSPVCNELWVYWENQRMALRFAADGDLANSRLWEQMPLHVRVLSLEQSVAASSAEAPGAGGLVARDWAGRLLYNCVVLGRTFTVTLPAISDSGPPTSAR